MDYVLRWSLAQESEVHQQIVRAPQIRRFPCRHLPHPLHNMKTEHHNETTVSQRLYSGFQLFMVVQKGVI
jgi:hypothetical protein